MDFQLWTHHRQFGFVLACLLPMVMGHPQLSYRELQQLNVSCQPYDTCFNAVDADNDSLKNRVCECGEHCKKYGTCCVDSSYRDLLDGDRRYRPMDCYRVYGSRVSHFMVMRCDPRWHGDINLKLLCESTSQSLNDPITQAPATNRRSGVVYKNFYCAMCNNDLKGLTLWNVRISKLARSNDSPSHQKVSEDMLLKDMLYNDYYDQWGFFSGPNSENFDPVTINFEEPRGLEHYSRFCIRNMVSDCNEKWTDKRVRKKCLAYMSVVSVPGNEKTNTFGQQNLYRNAHCAICNYATVDSIRCWKGADASSASRPQTSFTLLLDVNPKDGEYVGRATRCKRGESYDEFFKKCRTLMCALPGFTLVNGRCRNY